jgi:hypothetical protein
MDGIPWQVVTAIATPVIAFAAWLGKKAWTVIEAHAERRTKGIEAIAPAIKTTMDEVRKHVTDHAEAHTEVVEKAERNIVAAVTTSEARVLAHVGIAQRLERVEAGVAEVKARVEPVDVTIPPERHARQGPASTAPVVPRHRQSHPSIGG